MVTLGLCLGAETVFRARVQGTVPGEMVQLAGSPNSVLHCWLLSVSCLYVSLSVFDVILQGPSERNVRGLLLCLALGASGDGAVVPMGGYVNEGGDLWCRCWVTAFSKATVARLF